MVQGLRQAWRGAAECSQGCVSIAYRRLNCINGFRPIIVTERQLSSTSELACYFSNKPNTLASVISGALQCLVPCVLFAKSLQTSLSTQQHCTIFTRVWQSSFHWMCFCRIRDSDGSVSVFEVGIGFRYFKVGSVFGIGVSKHLDVIMGIRYFSTFALF